MKNEPTPPRRKDEALRLTQTGLLPSEVASHMGVTASTIVQYLRTQVGQGAVRFSDIYFCWPPEKRAELDALTRLREQDPSGAMAAVRNAGRTLEDVDFYSFLRQPPRLAGDLYEHVSTAERLVHGLVHEVLVTHYGPGEQEYWRQGVPESIRCKCQERREQDPEPADSPFQYTNLIELSTILERKRTLFEPVLPRAYRRNPKQLKPDFVRLNRIRNAVMHRVRGRAWSEDDFAFAKQFRSMFETETTKRPGRELSVR